jgi:hypothetical protein
MSGKVHVIENIVEAFIPATDSIEIYRWGKVDAI